MHDNKKYNSVTLSHNYEYTLVSNLDLKNYSDDNIKNIYKQRWDVEVFFKILKNNFNFEHLSEHNKNKTSIAYQKQNTIAVICMYFAKIMEKAYYYNNEIYKKVEEIEKTNKDCDIKYVLKPNKTQIISGVFRIIGDVLKGNMTVKFFKTACNCYVQYTKNIIGLSNLRVAITPFCKWYVKGYTNKSDIYKIVNALIKKDPSSLNKNLKCKYKNTKIVKFNYK